MRYRTILFAFCLLFLIPEWVKAKDTQPLLTKEDCVRFEKTFYDQLRKPEPRDFFRSNEYRQCREAAFKMEPNAGLEILNSFESEGECNDLLSYIQKLEKSLLYYNIGNINKNPDYLQCCYKIENQNRCKGIFADDSEHFDALFFQSLPFTEGKSERLVFHSDKQNYVLQSLFFNNQAIPFKQIDLSAWEAVLPAISKSNNLSDIHILIAIFEWNGKGFKNSQMGTFRKAVWYYKAIVP